MELSGQSKEFSKNQKRPELGQRHDGIQIEGTATQSLIQRGSATGSSCGRAALGNAVDLNALTGVTVVLPDRPLLAAVECAWRHSWHLSH